jgi:RNA polymerase sigma factor (sigma-70 family)
MVVKLAASPILHLLRGAVADRRVRELPDHELLHRFHARQDEAAFHALLHRHGPMVLDVCRAVLGRAADAEDAFQATFLVLTRKAGSLRKAASLGSWLHGVAYRTALKARAQSATRQVYEARAPVRQASEPDDLSWREVQRVLHEELNRLSERYRLPLVLCYLQGKTQEQAADELGLAKSTLRERVERGRDLLRARLVRRGLGPSAVLAVAAWPAAKASAAVPLSLVTSTLEAASLFAAGPLADAGALSTNAVTLMEGVLKTMLPSKIKTAAALGLVLLTFIGGTLALLPGLAARDETAKKAEATGDGKEARATATPPKARFPDLTKIDRTIVKEPRYSTQPYYALLAIGPQAKKRVWLVVDGETLYVDRNGNGDLTEANERVQKPKKIQVAPGMYRWMDSFDIGEVEGLRLRLDFWVRNRDFVPDNDFDRRIRKGHEENGWEFATLWRVNPDGKNISAQVPLAFCRKAKDTQVCHLAGPLTFALRSHDAIVRHSDKNLLQVRIGTPGLPARKWSDPVFAPVGTNEVPADMHPVARFEFPHRDPRQPPIKVEAVLDQRC